MSSKIHGDIVKYRSLFPNSKENPSDMGDIQLATYEDKSKAVNVFRFLTQKNKKQGVIVIPLTFPELKAIIKGLVVAESHNLGITVKQAIKKVEKELNISIK